MPPTVLVTGAAGFVGTHLLRCLASVEPSSTIVAWRRPPTRTVRVAPPIPSPEPSMIRWETVDILDRSAVGVALERCRPDLVYHLAGVAGVHGSWHHSLATLEGNVRGTLHLLDGIEQSGQRTRLLLPGSALVYKPSSSAITEEHALGPVSPYGLSKLAQEMLGRHACPGRLQVLLTRSFTHLGPAQDPTFAASSFAYQIARIEGGYQQPVLKVGSLGARRDLTDVRDTVRAYVALMAHGVAGRPYNVCTGRSHLIGDVLDHLIALSRVRISRETDRTRLRPKDNPLLVGDPRRLAMDTGWKAEIPLKRTLQDLLDYWRTVVRTGWRPTHGLHAPSEDP